MTVKVTLVGDLPCALYHTRGPCNGKRGESSFMTSLICCTSRFGEGNWSRALPLAPTIPCRHGFSLTVCLGKCSMVWACSQIPQILDVEPISFGGARPRPRQEPN